MYFIRQLDKIRITLCLMVTVVVINVSFCLVGVLMV